MSNVKFLQKKLYSYICSFFLGKPKQAQLDALLSKMRNYDQTHEKVFGMAADLGREKELFGMTKEEKREADAYRRYNEALDEAELLGDQADVAPADFFVSLSDLSTFLFVKLLHCLLHHGCQLGT